MPLVICRGRDVRLTPSLSSGPRLRLQHGDPLNCSQIPCCCRGVVTDHMDVLLEKFLCVPDPEAPAVEIGGGGDGGGSNVNDGLPATRASDSDGQGGGGASS